MLHKLLADNASAKANKPQPETKPGLAGSLNLDEAYMSGVLAELVERSAGNVERVSTNTVPVINKVSAGYPKDFTDMSYPPRVADDYIGCPDVYDGDAFAARVHGDSMSPKYGQGDIVVFSPAATPKNGDDCFVRFADGQTTFKRVFFENDEAGESIIRLQPRNEKYRPQVVKSEEVGGLYKAVYRYQRCDED
jgi:SOS-response transcriptional repressor LexA